MIETTVSKVETLEKIPLTVPLYVNMVNAGKSQTDISKLCQCSNQNVSQFKYQHLHEIELALDKSDGLQISRHRLNIARASQKLTECIENVDTKKDRNIIPLVAVIDRLTPAMRLLEGKSTENVSIQALMDDLQGKKADLLAKLSHKSVGEDPKIEA